MSAVDKRTSIPTHLTITSDEDRKADLAGMVQWAEKERERLKAMHYFRSFASAFVSCCKEECLAEQVSFEDFEKLRSKAKEIRDWVEDNALAEADECENKLIEMKSLAASIITKLFQANRRYWWWVQPDGEKTDIWDDWIRYLRGVYAEKSWQF